MFAQGIHRWQLGLAQKVERAGQQHRHGTGRGHGDGVVLGHELQVIGRQRLVTRRQAGTGQGRQLLGMQLDRQAQLASLDEHPLDLGRGERQVFTECIHGIDQPFGRQCRKHHLADMADVIVSPVLVLRRQGMRRQAGTAHGQWQLFTEAANDLEQLAFAGQVQAVAGLDLQGGDAITHQRLDPLAGTDEQFIFAGRASCPHGAGNATTLGGDLGIADPLQALLELAAAIATEHRVGVAVDQPRRDPGAAQVHGSVSGNGR
ncbi:hypothetical protein D9M71_428910 [compost metagenome]